MREFKNIKKYTSYFHDGSVREIQAQGKDIYLLLESAELDPSEFEDGFRLNKNNRIKGKLCLKNVNKIVVNDKVSEGPLYLISSIAEILDLELHQDKVYLSILWHKPGDRNFEDYTSNEIYCDQAIFYIDEGKE